MTNTLTDRDFLEKIVNANIGRPSELIYQFEAFQKEVADYLELNPRSPDVIAVPDEKVKDNIENQKVPGPGGSDITIMDDPFIKKHLAIIWEKTKEAKIEIYIKPMFDSLQAASIKYFLETGVVNGGFREALNNLMDSFKNYIASTQPTKEGSDAVEILKRVANEINSRSGITIDPEIVNTINELIPDSIFKQQTPEE